MDTRVSSFIVLDEIPKTGNKLTVRIEVDIRMWIQASGIDGCGFGSVLIRVVSCHVFKLVIEVSHPVNSLTHQYTRSSQDHSSGSSRYQS
jgi:hypothetical protein